jgi:hypothetical protein
VAIQSLEYRFLAKVAKSIYLPSIITNHKYNYNFEIILKITNDYVRNSSLFVSLAKAIGRIIISYKDISELAGYTYIVNKLDVTIDDLDKGYY